MAMRKLFWKLLLLPLLGGPLGALADPIYSLTFLPQNFYASAINNAGHIVGTAGGGAAIWSDTSITYFAPGSEGLAINNRDEVAGRMGTHGFIYSGGVVRDVDTGPYRSWATGINDAGRVSGTARNIEEAFIARAFVWVDGALTTILTFGGYADFGNAVNNAGQIAGFASTGGGDYTNPDRNAFLYDLLGNVSNLGSLGGRVSEANDLNDAGQVVGWSETSVANEERPFLYEDSGMVDLGSLGGRAGRAYGINNAGMVVGMSEVGAGTGFDFHAFRYANHQLMDLNTLIDPASGWRLVSATDINDAQQILGKACQVASSECRAVRLDLIPGVPEPGAWAMLLAGLALVAWRRTHSVRGREKPDSARRYLRKLLLLPLLASPLAALADPVYAIKFLPAEFNGANINNAGQIVRTSENAAAIWSETGITDIGAIAPGSMETGINSRGEIAGDWQGDAFVYTPAGLRNIGRLGVWNTSQGRGINDAGQVAGNAQYGVGERQRGFVYNDGAIRIIPTLGGDWSFIYAINNAGSVAGVATLVDPEFFNPARHAIVYRDGVMQDLGTLGGVISEAYDINNAGQVVGMSEVTPDFKSDEPHPFLYENGTMVDLGLLGGVRARALGINNAGLIVGASEWSDDQPFDFHGFLYANHTMVDLNTLIDPAGGWQITSARDINDAGQILATACRMEGCTTVRLDLIGAVPEPKVWGMLLAGLALMASRRRRAFRSETFS